LTNERFEAALEEEALQYAVEFAAESGDKTLVDALIAHLMGDGGNGMPKAEKFENLIAKIHIAI
jgi:hypothetical protein